MKTSLVSGHTIIAHNETETKNGDFSSRVVCVTQNPLNRHGNTFQGFPVRHGETKPGSIKPRGSSDLPASPSKLNPQNLLNRHGNTFQGLPVRHGETDY